jgi:hypothetical protein
MALMNQKPKKKTVAKKTSATKSSDPYKGMKDAWGNPVGGPGNVPPFEVKKKVTTKKKK